MRSLIYILLILTLISCEKEQDWTYSEGPLPDIVVEGIFTNESKAHEVRLHLPTSSLNEDPVPISGATVRISGSDTTYLLSEDPLNPGYYYTDSTVQGIVNKTYTLEIQYNSKLYSATDSLIAGEMFTPLQLSLYNENDSTYEITWVCSNYSPNKPALYEIIFDWRHVSGYDSAYAHRTLYFYTLSSIDVGQFLSGPDQKIIIPKGTKIKERRYSISPDYAAFLREVIIETQYNNGLVNMIPTNTIGNVNNNGAGFFSCGGVVEYIGVAGD